MRISGGELARFTEDYRGLFHDQRWFEGFRATLWGILASGSPLTGTSPHAERRLRRLLHGHNQRAAARRPTDKLIHTR